MAAYCEKAAADPGLLARPDVQKLTPYQSARRIMQAAGVTGEGSLADYGTQTLTFECGSNMYYQFGWESEAK